MIWIHCNLVLVVVFAFTAAAFCPVQQQPSSSRFVAASHQDTSLHSDSGDVQEDFEIYSRCLSPKQERKSVLQESQEYAILDEDDQTSRMKRLRSKIARKRWLPSSRRRRKKPGHLVLLINGQSTWADNDIFMGWCDPPLSEKGWLSSEHAARLMIAEGLQADLVYTSRLTRGIQTARAVLAEWDALYLPVRKTFRLNGRMYGAVQGLSKVTVSQQLGASVVQAWRNSYKARPPPLPHNDPASPAHDRRYKDLDVDLIPVSESAKDCQERARPLWEYRIRSDLEAGNNVMIVAHRDSLRGIIQQVHPELTASQINEFVLPSGVPVVFRFDRDMKPILVEDEDDPRRLSKTTMGVFLEKPGLLAKAMERQIDYKRRFDQGPVIGGSDRASTVERALWQLRQEQQELYKIQRSSQKDARPKEEAAVDSNQTKTEDVSEAPDGERWTDDPREMDDDFQFFGGDWDDVNAVGDLDAGDYDDFEFESVNGDEEEATLGETVLNIVPASSQESAPHPQDEPVVVLVRHGRTPHNNMGLFTGWEDPPLAPDGEEDAKRAGRLLKRHGFEFDVAYVSQLTRAIQTASFILDEMNSAWLPLVKSWRLNERHYGALTGKSKKMIENEYGKEQLVKWRRGYKIKPPAVSSFSPNYPGNDVQRTKHVTDLPVAWIESVFRSLEQRRPVLHRRFPKSESLHDCMQRSIPFYTQRIVKEAVEKNKRVLIASHENAIRGILMHLCDIPEEAMRQLHLPNGLPLVYSVKGKCITLLEDDLDDDAPKTTVDDFGPAAKYLFRPCELDDSFFEEMENKAEETTSKQEPTKQTA